MNEAAGPQEVTPSEAAEMLARAPVTVTRWLTDEQKARCGVGDDKPAALSVYVTRARDRAAECARDAAECAVLGRYEEARSLLREALGDLDQAERREGK